MKVICDCGVEYFSMVAAETCQLNNHGRGYGTDAANAADAQRYRRIRAARRFVGMLETVTMLADTDADYDAAVDRLPAVKP